MVLTQHGFIHSGCYSVITIKYLESSNFQWGICRLESARSGEQGEWEGRTQQQLSVWEASPAVAPSTVQSGNTCHPAGACRTLPPGRWSVTIALLSVTETVSFPIKETCCNSGDGRARGINFCLGSLDSRSKWWAYSAYMLSYSAYIFSYSAYMLSYSAYILSYSAYMLSYCVHVILRTSYLTVRL